MHNVTDRQTIRLVCQQPIILYAVLQSANTTSQELTIDM